MRDDNRLIYGEWDGLSPDEQAALEARGSEDPAVQEAREAARQLKADLRALGPRGTELTPPPLDWARLADSAPPGRAPIPWLAAAAAAILLAAGGWWAMSPERGADVETPATAALPAPPATPAPAPGIDEADPTARPDPEADGAPKTIAVAFAVRAPAAHAVTVAGDFNNWAPASLAMQRTPDGLWTAQASLPPGRYAYMYVVDGQWITPPDARRTQDDGFGARNGVLDLLAPSDV